MNLFKLFFSDAKSETERPDADDQSTELRTLSSAEVAVVAGGPQTQNDQI